MGAQLTLKQKLDILPAVVATVFTIIYAALTGLFHRRAKTWYLHIAYAVLRRLTRRLSPLQMQYVSPSTNELYASFMKKSKDTPRSIPLGASGGYGHWLGSPDAANVLVWYHGGGFALPANRGYFKFFARMLADARKKNKSLSVFCLGYTLTPHAAYPTQLRQAVECLRYVLKDHKPGSVVLGGDSAGGNLVGGVLSHLAHPHPDIEPLSVNEQLRGAVLMSPWTSLDTEFPGQIIDSSGDIITEHVAAPWAGAYLGSAARDFYTDLSRAPTEWYAAMPVGKMLVCAGATEIMLPMLEQLVSNIRSGRQVEFCVGERECHVAPIYHLYVGVDAETEQGKRAKEWLWECL